MAILRSSFIALSRNAALRRFSERSSLGGRLSSRFVAGMTVEDVLAAAESVNAQGISATLDSLGESVATAAEAQRSADIYHRLLDAIKQRGLKANVSVKLSQMGLEVDPALAYDIARELVEHAVETGNFVRIDMEGSDYTSTTLDIVRRLRALSTDSGSTDSGSTEGGAAGHVGVVIQAYLYRSQADIEALLAERIRIRLCKGAYQEPPNVAFPAKADVDANFVKLMEMLLPSGVYHGIATHDEAMIDATRRFVKQRGIDPKAFEFQMLYGVRRDLQRSLVAEGYGMRVYIPFGPEWYPYFMRRLAERPANVLFLARNFFRS
jgi:proline dehydrogenase